MSSELGVYGLVKLAGALLATTVAGPAGPYELPNQSLQAPPPPHSGLVSYADGQLAGRLGRPGEGTLSYRQAPQMLIDAIIASEDAGFYDHPGVDPVATLRALMARVSGGRVQGASTLVQQTIKNAVLSPEQSLERKVIEAILALRVTQVMDRRDILGVYLETVYFGRGSHGFSAASYAWFGKPWDRLDIGEIAFIAGVVQSPSALDPKINYERSVGRRNYVLGRLAATGVISQEDADHAIAKPLEVVDAPQGLPGDFNWVTSAALRDWPADASDSAGISVGADVTISTTIDRRWQDLIDSAVPSYMRSKFASEPVGSVNLEDGLTPDDWTDARSMLPGPSLEWEPGIITGPGEVAVASGEHLNWKNGYATGSVVAINVDGAVVNDMTPPGVQVAVVVLDVANGAVLASSGGFDASMTRYNRVWSSRQLGSSIKPFLWLAALDSGMPFDQMVLDSPVTITLASGERWTPVNYDRLYSGAMPLYAALEQSSNLVAARLGQAVGIENFARVAEAAGVYGPGQMRQHPSAVLGTSDSSLLQLTAGYASIVNGGMAVDPHIVTSIEGGRLSWTWQPPRNSAPVAGDMALQNIKSMLRGVIVRGTASVAFADVDVPVIGKTGTSQEHRDAWFVGMTDRVAVGVWLGRDDNSPIAAGATGGTLAGQIAAQIFTFAAQDELLPESGENWPPIPLDARSVAGVGTWTANSGMASDGFNDLAPIRDGLVLTSPQDPPHGQTGDDYFAVENPNADLLGGSSLPRQDGGLVFRSPW